MERHPELDGVVRAPVRADRHVGARHRLDLLVAAVDLHEEAAARPVRHAHLDVELAAPLHDEPRGVGVGEIRHLLHDHLALGPVQRRGDEEVDVERLVVGAPEVDRVLELRVALERRAVAAGEPVHLRVAEPFLRAGIERHVIGVARIVFGDGREDVVVERLLVVIHVLRGLVVHEQLPIQFQQVVGRAGLVLAAVGEAVLPERIRLGDEALGVVRDAGAGHAPDAVHVVAVHHLPEVRRDQVVRHFPGIAEGLERPGDLRDVLVGVPTADRVDVLRQAPLVAGVAEEEVGVVEQLRALDEPLVAGETEQARHHLVHAAVLAGDVGPPHLGARLRGQRLQPRVGPRPHSARDVERLLVARHLVAVEQPREDLVQRVVRRPDLRVLRAVGGALLEHDELVRRIAADEPRAPVPVVGADRAGAQVGVVSLAVRPRWHRRRIGHGRTAWRGGFPRLLREVVQRVDQVIHLPEKVRAQRFVIGRARVGLRDRREIVAAGMAAQPRRLVVPSFELHRARRLGLSERVPEVVEEVVGIAGRKRRE